MRIDDKNPCCNTTQPCNCSALLAKCFMPMGILVVLAVPVFYWLSQNEMGQELYWQSQVDSFIYLNHSLSAFPNLWSNLTQLGDAFLLLPLLSFFIIGRPAIWAAFFGAIPVASLLTHGGKTLATIPRPAAVLDSSYINVIGEKLAGSNSLPSGHTSTVFVAGTVILLMYVFSVRHSGRWLMVLAVIAVTTTLAISRVAVGAHWPLDIAIGALCGITGGLSGIYLTQRYTKWWHWMKHPTCQVTLGAILLFWSVSLIPALQSEPPSTLLAHWLSSIVGMFSSCLILYFPLRSRYQWNVAAKIPSANQA